MAQRLRPANSLCCNFGEIFRLGVMRATERQLYEVFLIARRPRGELDPGLWQDTETGEEDGKPVEPDVTTDCMTRRMPRIRSSR